MLKPYLIVTVRSDAFFIGVSLNALLCTLQSIFRYLEWLSLELEKLWQKRRILGQYNMALPHQRSIWKSKA